MLAPSLQVAVCWRTLATTDPALRARLTAEIRALSWTLNQMEALLDDAHRCTGLEHAYLMPRIELRLPLYDVGLRYRLLLTHVDRARISLVDEEGRKLADVTLH